MNNEYFTIQQASEGIWGAISFQAAVSLGMQQLLILRFNRCSGYNNLPHSGAVTSTAEQLTNKR
jgi:hypothetical protein